MVQLLNRFAWLLSFLWGIFIYNYVFGNYFYRLNDYGFWNIHFFGVVLGGIIGMWIKHIFFSKAYIESRVDYLATRIIERAHESNTIVSITQETSPKNTPADTPMSAVEHTSWEKNPETIPQKEVSYYDYQDDDDTLDYIPASIAASQKSETPDDELKYQFQVGDAISKFFSENLLAKLGGILVFLGVFFFLALIYTIVGPVTKMLIGFAIGAATFFGWVWLDKKWYTNESRIVMGTAILINYMVILAGRYLLDWETETWNLLPIGITFLFLILNTLFAVTTALVYQSHALLIFSFVFAYINPLLLGTSSQEPYTLLGYTMIVTLGAMFMSYTRKDILLFVLAFVFSAFLFLGAPSQDSSGWITKLLCINTLWALSLYVSTVFQKKYQYINELLIGGTFFLIGILGILGIMDLSAIELGILWTSSLALMFFCYISMHRGAYLYSIGTLWSVLTLMPALIIPGKETWYLSVSTAIIVTFAILNIGVILVKNKNLLWENIGNILGGLISGALFLTYMLYAYGNIYFPGMLLGFAFFVLAVIYVITAFILVQKIGIDEMKSQEKYRNIFYVLSALWISLFSLSVAFVFANKAEIVALIWILESTVLFYFARKLASPRITLAALIMLAIGVFRLLPFLEMSLSGNYGLLVSALLITLSLMSNLFILMRSQDSKGKNIFSNEVYGLHHIFHIIGITSCSIFILNILNIKDDWYLLLAVSLILAGLWYIYSLARSPALQKIHMIVYLGGLFIHVGMFLDDMGRDSLNLMISSLIIAVYALPFILESLQTRSIKNLGLFAAFLGYIFILSTLYIYHIFDSTFAVTLYWGVLSFGLLSYWIQKDIIQLRTIGLYLICLTAGKIFFYDIWIGMDNTIARVAALMVVGILMIILSTMYTRKYGNTLNREFNLENLFPKNSSTLWKDTSQGESFAVETQKAKKEAPEKKNTIQEDIENITLDSDIIWVRMYINGTEKPIQIRAQNLMKIAKLIENTLHKTEFASWELKDTYTIVTQNYKSSLPTEQYKKIEEIVWEFAKHGGKMEFVRK